MTTTVSLKALRWLIKTDVQDLRHRRTTHVLTVF